MVPAFALILSRATITALATGDVRLADALSKFDPVADGAHAFERAWPLAHRCALAAGFTEVPMAREAFSAAQHLLMHAYALGVGLDALASVASPGLALARLAAERARMPYYPGSRAC